MDGYSPVLPILLYQDGIGRPIAEQAQAGSFASGRIPHHALEYPGPTVHHRRGALCPWAADRDGEESGTVRSAVRSRHVKSTHSELERWSHFHQLIAQIALWSILVRLVGRAVESIAVYRPGGRSWLLRGRARVRRKSGYLRMSCRMAISACTVPSSRGALSVPIEPCASASDGTSCTPLVSHGCDGATPPDLSGG
jgi:hypothetical protein